MSAGRGAKLWLINSGLCEEKTVSEASPSEVPRVNVLGVGISALNMNTALEQVLEVRVRHARAAVGEREQCLAEQLGPGGTLARLAPHVDERPAPPPHLALICPVYPAHTTLFDLI